MKPFSNHAPELNFKKPTPEQIAVAAYQLYVENGCQDGHDLDDWLRAEDLLMQKLKPTAKVQVSDINPEFARHPVRVHSAAAGTNPFVRDERGSASREEIRQKNTPNRPGARQTHSRTERSK